MTNQVEPRAGIADNVNFGEPDNYRPVAIQNVYEAGSKKKQIYDYSYLADTQGIKNFQSIFIDNYENDKDVIFQNLFNDQKIVCKAGKQGYFPLLIGSKLKFNIFSETEKNIKINFYLMNYIISQGTW